MFFPLQSQKGTEEKLHIHLYISGDLSLFQTALVTRSGGFVGLVAVLLCGFLKRLIVTLIQLYKTVLRV